MVKRDLVPYPGDRNGAGNGFTYSRRVTGASPFHSPVSFSAAVVEPRDLVGVASEVPT